MGASSASAQQPPVVLLPVVTDPVDAPRLLALAKVLRTAMADRGIPTVAAQYTRTIEAAKETGDAFATALDLSGEFPTLRYDLYSDELVRAHALRLIELAKAGSVILLAAPIANRIVLKRVSRGEGQSIALPDPCEPELAQQALTELLPPEDPRTTSSPERTTRSALARKWLLGTSGAVGIGAAAITGAIAVRRQSLGTRFQNAAPSDSDYLARGDDWRERRAPMLAASSVAAASLSITGVIFASHYELRKLHWVSMPATALATAALGWATVDIARGANCPVESTSDCMHAQSQLDRGILLALASAPALAITTTHLSRWIGEQISVNVDASSRAASVHLAYRQ